MSYEIIRKPDYQHSSCWDLEKIKSYRILGLLHAISSIVMNGGVNVYRKRLPVNSLVGTL